MPNGAKEPRLAAREEGTSGVRASRIVPDLWALVLGAFLLGPALSAGFVLSYDMVWVPDLALRADTLGLGSSLPRAVPSDAVVAVLDEVVPGMLLQKLVLLGGLVLAGAGAARLADSLSLAGRLAAVSIFLWNPFVVERLLMGHWPVILGYAVLPWLLVAGRRVRTDGRVPPSLLLLVPLGSLSAGAGLATAAVLLACTLVRGRNRRNLGLFALVAAANAPWVVAGVLHAGTATSAQVGARLFALAGPGSVPAPAAAIGLGGTWNSEVVLPSRTTLLGVLAVVAVVVLAACGFRAFLTRRPAWEVRALVVVWVLGMAVALSTWALPDATGWLVAHVPGTGLVRDGARFLALCAPLLASLVGHGVDLLVSKVPVRLPRTVLAVGLVVLPVGCLPDAALGAAGRLGAVDPPPAYADAREEVSRWQAAGGDGDVVVLPFTSYRAPSWNGGRKVLDPLARWLTVETVTSDVLVVSGTPVPGEDPRARAVQRVLDGGEAGRNEGLASLGVGLVVTDSSSAFTVRELDGVVPRPVPASWVAAMVPTWATFGLVVLAGVLVATRDVTRRRHTER